MFYDQYMGPWEFARQCEGLDIREHVGALLIRLPLSQVALKHVSITAMRTPAGNRGSGTPASRHGYVACDVLEEVQSCLEELQIQAGRTLLFMRRLQVKTKLFSRIETRKKNAYPAFHL
jgi:hypothetical protein